MRLGKNQVRMLIFLFNNPGWKTVSVDTKTRRIVDSLFTRQLILLNNFQQVRLDNTHIREWLILEEKGK